MNCEKCGNELKEDAKFCDKCGGIVNDEGTNKANSEKVPVAKAKNKAVGMSILRLVVSILSLVASVLILFQSCAAGFINSVEGNGSASGSAGVLLAVLWITAGIVGIVARRNYNGTLVTGIIYFIAGGISIPLADNFPDLIMWGTISLIFGAIFCISLFVKPKV